MAIIARSRTHFSVVASGTPEARVVFDHHSDVGDTMAAGIARVKSVKSVGIRALPLVRRTASYRSPHLASGKIQLEMS
jgi:hypothetical protein